MQTLKLFFLLFALFLCLGNFADALTITNSQLEVEFNSTNGAFAVLDKRANHRWAQQPMTGDVELRKAEIDGSQIKMIFRHKQSGLEATGLIALEPDKAELVVELNAKGTLRSALKFPHPFVSDPSTRLIVPMNEGISYPANDDSISPMRLIAYGGHGISMGFWGATAGPRAYMAIIETPDDAAIRIDRLGGLLAIAPEWEPEKGQFGYPRRLRYVFFDAGGHVAICKRYRAYAKQIGLLKTLTEKREANPYVDLLVGAVNVWCWDRAPLTIIQEMKELGIDRILWSNRQPPDVLQAMNELGVLTSRYDIYQDVMNPENFQHLRGVHPDWPTEAWPKDLMLGPDSDWVKGWRVKGKDDNWYPCGVLCDRQAPAYARKRITDEIQTHSYRCRFIDTTTASSWRECYDPDHPMTRAQSRFWKMELLRFVSQDAGLVTGSETGHDAAVPYVHYFEGMLSLGPYRVPDAGRNMQQIWAEAPERVEKFQLGHAYRLPLWELVYHDCVVAQWYWGDYNNKLPVLWDKRDLFNLLYGTPPMFMFNRQLWGEQKARFAQSYKNICPTVRAVGYSEMIDHRLLASDRSVQQTVFDNGTIITVNFGADPYQLSADITVKPMGFHVQQRAN